ncbi:5266_t:CDS:2 [Entrophospora sp. SA101]|nr:3635_t:CDS:2 [Entrophospora sp. SA101]CAJ0747324.1 5266_t:CDS:2 [Entrophospora sp. SA101]CAJ0843379.1 3063_t:CDS:2 [Entrophospora sp. SA101]CAJ0923639.1 4916_t:CDS:2 [Entrophospora sp. SA101]
MGKLQRIYTIENYASSSFVIPSKIRQRLYGIQSNLNVCVLNEDIMAILEEEVERMFLTVDELEKVMNKLDCQMAKIDDENTPTPIMATNDNDIFYEQDDLKDIHQNVIFLIKTMEENMERLERIMKKFIVDRHYH